VIPETAGALLALLLLVGPALAFAGVRELYGPAGQRSTFREVSEAAAAGLLFSLGALTLLAALGAAWSGLFPDPGTWIRGGADYVASNLGLVLRFIGSWAALSIGAASGTSWLLYHKRGGRVTAQTNVWFEMFRGKAAPPDAEPMVRVRLTSGTEYIGMLSFYDLDAAMTDRSLVLGPPLQQRSPGDQDFRALPNEGAWSRVIIPASFVESIWVRFRLSRRRQG